MTRLALPATLAAAACALGGCAGLAAGDGPETPPCCPAPGAGGPAAHHAMHGPPPGGPMHHPMHGPPPGGPMHHGMHGPPPGAPGPGLATPSAAVELPAAAGGSEPKEAKVLVDEPALKLVSIVLRKGTVLPEHDAPVPVTIQALEGAGHVTMGEKKLRLDRGHAVVLAAGVPHAVEPDAGTHLVLLLHHLGGGGKRP